MIGCEGKTSAQAAGKPIDNAAKKSVDALKDTWKAIKEETVKVGDAVADSAITAKVKTIILAEPGLKVLDIDVATTNNVTTLTGSVDSMLNSNKAEEITKAVDGVMSVDNQLLLTTALL